ncbi:hypothetical protein V8F06_000442 [Rhypophila decipiens]
MAQVFPIYSLPPKPADDKPLSLSLDEAMKELELELRKRAKDHMALALADKPNGTTTRPPPWYRRADDIPSSTADFSSLIRLGRPRIWIKDWDKGHIRPLELDESEDEQEEPATQLAIRLKMPKSIAADESQTELVGVRVRVIANKRRRLAENAPNGDDSEVVSS